MYLLTSRFGADPPKFALAVLRPPITFPYSSPTAFGAVFEACSACSPGSSKSSSDLDRAEPAGGGGDLHRLRALAFTAIRAAASCRRWACLRPASAILAAVGRFSAQQLHAAAQASSHDGGRTPADDAWNSGRHCGRRHSDQHHDQVCKCLAAAGGRYAALLCRPAL